MNVCIIPARGRNTVGNWQFWMVVHMVCFTAWSLIAKRHVGALGWQTTLTYVWGTAFLCNLALVFRSAHWGLSVPHLWCILGGILAALGTIAMYRSLSVAPGHVIYPLTIGWMPLAVIGSVIFLREPIGIRSLIGTGAMVAGAILINLEGKS